MRVQNEGNGKSSWWMLNPEAKPGKGTTRRPRSGSLDSAPKSDGRKRGRKKEKIKEIGERPVSPSVVGKNGSRGINRSSSPGNVSPTNNSMESLLPEHFSDSFGRPRTSSNASANSSIHGRLSPIHDQDELDDQLDDDSHGMSPCGGNMATSSTSNQATDELIKTIEERMFVESPVIKPSRSPVSMMSDASPINEMHSPAASMSGYDTGYDSSGFLTTPNHHGQQTHGIFSPMNPGSTGYNNVPPQQVSFQNQNGFPDLQQQQPTEAQQNLLHFTREQEMEVQQQPAVYGNQGQNFSQNMSLNHTPNTMNQSVAYNETYFPGINGGNPAIIINSNPAMQSTTLQHQQTPITMNGYARFANQNIELTQARYPFPSDLEGFGIAEDLDFDCDVQSIIQSEMGDGGFDCLNLDQIIAAQSVNTPVSVGDMRLY